MSDRATQTVLSPQDHDSFVRHGFLILKNAVPPDTVAAALETLEGGTFQGNPGAADYQPLHAATVDDCVTPTIRGAIAELFGPDYPFAPARPSDMPRPYEPDARWKTQDVHADDDYPSLMPAGWALGLFIFLTPVRPHGGAFLYADGSPQQLRLILEDNPEWLHFYRSRPDIAASAQEFLAQPGDALLFHHLLAHAGSNNVADPTTRHALLSRWHPQRRIVPGGALFERMSTIERANSARYQAQLTGDDSHLPALRVDRHTDEALRRGIETHGGVRAHAVLRFGGATHAFFVDEAEPGVVRHEVSRDWAAWEPDEASRIEPAGAGDAVRSLSLFHGVAEALLFVGLDGETGETPRTVVLTSHDLRAWSPVTELPGALSAAGHFTTDYSSATARGNVVFVVPADAPSTVQARWGQNWAEAARWDGPTTVYEGESGTTIADAFVRPILGEEWFALVADAQEGDAPEASRPSYSLSRDSTRYVDALQPLAYSTPTPPRRIRRYASARRYWLVTYLRDVDEQGRLCWGAIDWERQPVALQEIATAQELQEALYTVGLL